MRMQVSVHVNEYANSMNSNENEFTQRTAFCFIWIIYNMIFMYCGTQKKNVTWFQCVNEIFNISSLKHHLCHQCQNKKKEAEELWFTCICWNSSSQKNTPLVDHGTF